MKKKSLPLTVAAVKSLRSPLLPGRTVRARKGKGSYNRRDWKRGG